MLKKTISYTDFDGNDRSEEFYFNLTKAELLGLNFAPKGGLENTIRAIMLEEENFRLYDMFTDIVKKAYGEKSVDGKRFVKTKEMSDGFEQTPAFSELIVELITVEGAAESFINGIMPKIPEDHKTAEPQRTSTDS